MTQSIGNFQVQNTFRNTQTDDQHGEQKLQLSLGRGAGFPLFTGMPTPSVRGETQSSSLPGRDETRPAGDQRTAGQILDDNPILQTGILWKDWDRSPKGLERREKLIENLKQQVGDFTAANTDPQSRADAMYRLARVVNYIDNDPGVERAGINRPGDGFLDETASSTATSEIGRLEAFGERGYAALEDLFSGRATGDKRTVEQITAGPLFKAVEKALDADELKTFKARVGGDWEDPHLPADVRADFAANAERILQIIDGQGGEGSTADNGEIDGMTTFIPLLPKVFLTEDDYTLKGSEARRLTDFVKDGLSALHKA